MDPSTKPCAVSDRVLPVHRILHTRQSNGTDDADSYRGNEPAGAGTAGMWVVWS